MPEAEPPPGSQPKNVLVGGVIGIGAYRTTNDNMLSLFCEFLKPPRGRWFQKFG
jgi:hypothetical protein